MRRCSGDFVEALLRVSLASLIVADPLTSPVGRKSAAGSNQYTLQALNFGVRTAIAARMPDSTIGPQSPAHNPPGQGAGQSWNLRSRRVAIVAEQRKQHANQRNNADQAPKDEA
jgi:hypothetical protein